MARMLPSPARGLVCVIDDDDWICDSLGVLLEAYDFAVLTYPSAQTFLDAGRGHGAECLIVDQHMPGMAGLDLIAELQRRGACPPAILITGRLDAHIAERAQSFGVLAVLEKPFPVARLVDLIGNAIAPR